MATEAAIASKDAVREGQKPSLRTCIVTRAELAPAELIRFVPSPDGSITPDLARKLPGRGVWVTCRSDVLADAVARKSFAKSLKRQITVPADLVQQVELLMVRRTIEALSLANKAGLVTTGFSKIDAELVRGGVEILVHAMEAAEDGCGKLDRKWTAIATELGRRPCVVKELTIAQLDLAIGRENVVHAALSAGGATNRFSIEAERLGRYRLHDSSPASESTAD